MSAGPRRALEARLRVRVIPRAGRDAIDGSRDGALLLRVAAPPLDGAANAAVCRLIADALAVPATDVTVIAGAASRRKVVRVRGVEPAAVVSRWPDLGV